MMTTEHTQILYKKQHGLTLLELLVAVTIAIFIFLAVGKIMISSRKNNLSNQALAHVQENGRAAITFLQQQIRMAGYGGVCLTEDLSLNNAYHHLSGLPANTMFEVKPGIKGYRYNITEVAPNLPNVSKPKSITSTDEFSPKLPEELTSSNPDIPVPIKNSDVLIVRYIDPIRTISLGKKSPDPGDVQNETSNNVLTLNSGSGEILEKGELLRVERCADLGISDTFFNQTATPSVESKAVSKDGNDNWHAEYRHDAQIYSYKIKAYFVGIDPVSQQVGLYEYMFDNKKLSLIVPGVTLMQLRYHINDSKSSIEADKVENWHDISVVDVALLMQSTESSGNLLSDKEIELLEDKKVKVESSYFLYRPFFTSTALRSNVITSE